MITHCESAVGTTKAVKLGDEFRIAARTCVDTVDYHRTGDGVNGCDNEDAMLGSALRYTAAAKRRYELEGFCHSKRNGI